MPKRVSKIRLPRPVTVDFAQELAALMLGTDASVPLRQYTTGQILMGAWVGVSAPVNLSSLYNYLQGASPLDAKRFEQDGTGKHSHSAAFQDALDMITHLEKALPPSEDSESLALEAASRWYEGMRKVGADGQEAAALFELLQSVGIDVTGDDPASAGAAGLTHMDTAEGGHVLVLGAQSGPGVPSGMIEVLNMMGLHSGMAKAKAPVQVTGTPVSRIDSAKPALQVYDRQKAIEALQRMPESASPLDGTVQQRRLLEAMAGDTGMRQLGEVPGKEALDDLDEQFPHCKEILLFIREQLALAGCGSQGKPALLPPILLRGDPGVGKTYLGQELARVLQLPFIERDLSVTSEAFVLTGHDIGWKGAKPGIVFDALVNGRTANPVILLNEVDKVRDSGSHNSPINAMLALLEPTSAPNFLDEFCPVTINTSKVNWILTANENISLKPVVERLEEFDVPKPTAEQAFHIAQSVWRVMLKRQLPEGHPFSDTLTEELIVFMAKFNPRTMRKMFRQAAGKAIYAERDYLLLEDLEGSAKRYVRAPARIGF